MNTSSHQWGGLSKVEYLDTNDAIAFTNDLPETHHLVSVNLKPGKSWKQIPFIPETARYTVTSGFAPGNYVHTVSLELDGTLDQMSDLSRQLATGWKILRITDNNQQQYVIGTLDFPLRFTDRGVTSGTSQLVNIENHLECMGKVPHKALKVVI